MFMEAGLGRFAVKIKLANAQDLTLAGAGVMKPSDVRTEEIDGIVDTGTTQMVLPLAVADRLGLPRGGKMTINMRTSVEWNATLRRTSTFLSAVGTACTRQSWNLTGRRRSSARS